MRFVMRVLEAMLYALCVVTLSPVMILGLIVGAIVIAFRAGYNLAWRL